MMQKVCNVFSTENEKNAFLQTIENTYAQIIMDCLQLAISGKKFNYATYLTIITP